MKQIKGTTIMLIGSIVLINLLILMPRERFLYVAIPFIICETSLAVFFTLYNAHNKKYKNDTTLN